MPCPLRVVLAAVSALIAAVLLCTFWSAPRPPKDHKQQGAQPTSTTAKPPWRLHDVPGFVLSLFTGTYLLSTVRRLYRTKVD